jgi:hypothetical protein
VLFCGLPVSQPSQPGLVAVPDVVASLMDVLPEYEFMPRMMARFSVGGYILAAIRASLSEQRNIPGC